METIDPTKLLPEAFAADGQAPALLPPPDGAALLDEVCDTLARYIVFPSTAATVTVALWIAATHAQPLWANATRLLIKSPLRECGKSRLLDLIAELSYEVRIAANISPAALARIIGDDPPTVLLDEADTYLRKGNASETAELLRGILNAGHSRRRPYVRWNHTRNEPEECSTFAMAALAGTGAGWESDTVVSRAITIAMRRRGPGEQVAPFEDSCIPALHQLRERLRTWVRGSFDALRIVAPDLPVVDRAADNWRPLLKVATVAGGHWPETATAACLALTRREPTDDDGDVSERLLEDLREVFGQAEQLHTATILGRLHRLDEAPWAAWGRDAHLFRARDLAKLLRPYGVRSKDLREVGTGPVAKGYTAESLQDPWARYLPPVK